MELSKSYPSDYYSAYSSTNLSELQAAKELPPDVHPALKSRRFIRRRRNVDKWPELKTWLWNKELRTIMGRKPISWGQIGIFYFAFYAGIAALMVTCIGVFAVTVDEIYPRYTMWDSALKAHPGLSHRPMPDHESTLIRFEQGKPQSYKHFTDHIQVFLDQYENEKQVGENFIDCEKGRPPNTLNKVCRFNVIKLGGECTWQKDYGYDEGQPCILLKMNKLYKWRAEPYNQTDMDQLRAMRDAGKLDDLMDLPERFNKDHIGVTCNGRYDADFENIGNITFWPEPGFQADFYPFLNQEGFRSPLVMAKFWGPTNGILINIVCRAWARNIRHHVNDNLGLTKFELLVD